MKLVPDVWTDKTQEDKNNFPVSAEDAPCFWNYSGTL